jgi:RHS repeat-associated protein
VGNPITENNRAYLYDLNNRLVQVTENGNTLGIYTYDGQGRRVKKTANGQTTYYLYDLQNRLLGEVDGVSGAMTHLYAYLPDRPIAKIDLDGASPNLVYYHSDPVGTPLFITNSGGQVVWKAELLPFGEAYQINEDVDGNGVHVVNNLRFPGQYYDAETGLHYNMARDYEPRVGRYIEADPIGILSGENHLFVYVGNNPVNWIDPFGLQYQDPDKGEYGPLTNTVVHFIESYYGICQ